MKTLFTPTGATVHQDRQELHTQEPKRYQTLLLGSLYRTGRETGDAARLRLHVRGVRR